MYNLSEIVDCKPTAPGEKGQVSGVAVIGEDVGAASYLANFLTLLTIAFGVVSPNPRRSTGQREKEQGGVILGEP